MQITDEEKKSMAARKKLTQDELRDLIGILIDAPAQGSGNTNSGNTSRIFFENLDIVARITGLDRECLERSKNILTVLSCPYPANVEKVKQRTVNEDLFKRLLLNSDPLLSLSRSVREKKRSDLSDKVKNLLILDEDA
ncbi:hypothetical protein QAD02_003229 [Eretmocerus hayati]|uniref:Uncharacterized protein n=1 Tax=Eretmocerus hayati TaxID=131215 RepID=A0ACC2NQZ5_9HYME|nr:hypothetical protein QAD02_003229 [Eretmocerus hayati]